MSLEINKTALVLEGGGFRAMFTSGVLDAFLKYQIYYPYCIGVSAGAAYGISYISRQFERNRQVNLNYTADPRYMSWGNLLRKGNLFDWDFVYDEVPNRLIHLDYKTALNSNGRFMIGMTDVVSGEARYVQASELTKIELMQAVTASSSLPIVSRMADFRGQKYMDGGISDSIPVQKAIDDGNERLVVVLTRNSDYRKQAPKFKSLFKCYYRKYPKLADAIITRYKRYNSTLDLLDKLECEGKAFVIRPAFPMNVSRVENNPHKLDQLYLQGLQQTETMMERLCEWLANG